MGSLGEVFSLELLFRALQAHERMNNETALAFKLLAAGTPRVLRTWQSSAGLGGGGQPDLDPPSSSNAQLDSHVAMEACNNILPRNLWGVTEIIQT